MQNLLVEKMRSNYNRVTRGPSSQNELSKELRMTPSVLAQTSSGSALCLLVTLVRLVWSAQILEVAEQSDLLS
jgi:hypothetical protein